MISIKRKVSMDQIIKTPAEQDAYKDSMGMLILHRYMSDYTEWGFHCRNKDVKFTPKMVDMIKEQLKAYCTVKYNEFELDWMAKKMPWLKSDYIAYLRLWHPREEEIFVNGVSLAGEILKDPMKDENGCGLTIEARGPWLNVSPYEIAILAIVNEVYFACKYGEGAKDDEIKKATDEKIEGVKSGKYDLGSFSEFGLRRRYSGKMQDWIVGRFKEKETPGFVGTSNVSLAMKYGVKPIGTMAHELGMVLMSHDRYNPSYVNERIMEAWIDEYDTDLGIYLNDLLGEEVFLKDFNRKFAKGFDGLRHDSGDPFKWGDDMLRKYDELGIDPRTKTLLFSDSLNFDKATKINGYFRNRCKVAFGIGTAIVNPIPDALNIVCKVRRANGVSVCKLSNVQGKTMGESEEFIKYVQECIGRRLAVK